MGKSHNEIRETETKNVSFSSKEINDTLEINNVFNHFKSRSLDSLFFTEVRYSDKTIYIYKHENILVKIPYSYDEQVLPVNGLVISNDTVTYNYYIYKGLLFIPIREINNRMNMIILDLEKRKYLKYSNGNYLIPTSLNWFYLDTKTGLLVGSNQINTEGKTMIHYYGIVDNMIVLMKSKLVFLDEDISQNYVQFKKAISSDNVSD